MSSYGRLWRRRRLAIAAAGAGGGGGWEPALLLDEVEGAAAAYSLRKLRTAYAGAAVRVRESSGDTLADVGFDGNGDLDTAALLTHCGANSGFVATWYDQSGNGYDASQASTGLQPRIVDAGTVEMMQGQPAIRFDGSDDVLRADAVAAYFDGAVDYSLFAALQYLRTDLNDFAVAVGRSNNNNPVLAIGVESGAPVHRVFLRNQGGTAENPEVPILCTIPAVVTVNRNGSTFLVNVDDYETTVTALDVASPNRFAIGALVRGSASLHAQCHVSEVIAFDSALDATI